MYGNYVVRTFLRYAIVAAAEELMKTVVMHSHRDGMDASCGYIISARVMLRDVISEVVRDVIKQSSATITTKNAHRRTRTRKNAQERTRTQWHANQHTTDKNEHK